MKKLIFVLVAVFAVAASAVTFAAEPEAKKFGPNIGDYAKDFKLLDPTTAKDYTLADFTKTGKDTAFLFMQTACSLCVSELQEFLESKDELSGKLNTVMVSVDFDSKRIEPYKAAYKIPYPILHDPDAKFLESFQFASTPSMVLVDATGRIQKKTSGYDRADIKQLIKKYSK
jgi:peroxiredoxin